MRTKILVMTAAAMVAGVLASSAQVYSANVVGYVNTVCSGGFTLICNPLNASPSNTLSVIMPKVPDGTFVNFWDKTAQNFSSVAPTFTVTDPVTGAGIWGPDVVVNPGTGFFVSSGDGLPFTNTFVGDVLQGSPAATVGIVAGFTFIASPVPVGGDITNVLSGLVANDGDYVQLYDTVGQQVGATATFTETAGPGVGIWGWTPSYKEIGVGAGLFYNSSAPITWNRNFTVQ